MRNIRKALLFVVAVCAAQGVYAQFPDGNPNATGTKNIIYTYNYSARTATVRKSGIADSMKGYQGNIVIPDSVYLPSPFDHWYKVVGVDAAAFKNCTLVKSVSLSKGCATIGDSAFYNSGITEFSLPSDFSGTIGKHAFEKCTNLTKFGSLSGATTFDSYCFVGYTPADSKFVVPASVTRVNTRILRNSGDPMLDLDSLIVEDSDTPIASSRWNSFAFDRVNVHNYYLGRNVSNLRIAGAAYYESLTIGLKVTSVPSYLSSSRTESYVPLKTVRILNSDPSAVTATFNDRLYQQATLIVPDGTLEAYKNNASWGKFANIMEATQYATGVKSITTNTGSATETARYGVDGKQLASPRKGVNIVKQSGGTVKKVIVR